MVGRPLSPKSVGLYDLELVKKKKERKKERKKKRKPPKTAGKTY